MKYLIDTNIFLEIFLQQEKSVEAKNIFSLIEDIDFFVTDFTLRSIGIKLFKEKLYDTFKLLMTELHFKNNW